MEEKEEVLQLDIYERDREIHCVYLNDVLIAGRMPWGPQGRIFSFLVKKSDLDKANPQIDPSLSKARGES